MNNTEQVLIPITQDNHKSEHDKILELYERLSNKIDRLIEKRKQNEHSRQ